LSFSFSGQIVQIGLPGESCCLLQFSFGSIPLAL
jgi:hypothetical protein